MMKSFTKEYHRLIEVVRTIDFEAAEYMLNEAPKLHSFIPKSNINLSFRFISTPQGFNYWAKLNDKAIQIITDSMATKKKARGS